MAPTSSPSAPEAASGSIWAGSSQWDDLARAWRRRDNTPFRNLLSDAFRTPTAGGLPDASDPLLGWRRLSQAVFTDRVAPLDAFVADRRAAGWVPRTDLDDDTWETRACCAVDALLEHTADPSHDPEQHALEVATVVVFTYFECLVFWEHSDEYEQLQGVLDAAVATAGEQLTEVALRASALGDRSAVAELCTGIIGACRALCASMRAQFAYEQGLASSCHHRFEESARETTTQLRAVAATLVGLSGLLDDPGVRGRRRPLGVLLRLLVDDVDQTDAYHELLCSHVGPAVGAFDENLDDRAADAAVGARLDLAIAAARTFEASPRSGAGVFLSEARAHRITLEAMRESLRPDRPSLLVREGEIVFVYPFGLPVLGTDGDIVRQLLRRHVEGDPRPQLQERLELAGCLAVVDDTPQTSGWIRLDDDRERIGARLLFEDHKLVLETTAGERYLDLGLEVRLGALGNHYVRVSVATDTPVVELDASGRTLGRVDVPWTPHVIDQFVRRAGEDTGPQEYHLSPRDGDGERGDAEGFEYLTELVGRIVDDLTAHALRLGGGESTHADGDTEFVRRHAQVLSVVTHAVGVLPGSEQPVEDGAALTELFGGSVLWAPQRSFSTSLDEWARFADEGTSHSVEGASYRGVRGEHLVCSGDTTLLFAPTAPNWQILEDKELVEFAASLTGAYSTQRDSLRRTVDRAEQALRLSDGADDAEGGWRSVVPRIKGVPSAERLVEAKALRAEVSVQLHGVESLVDHARSAQVSRNQRDRAVLRQLCASNGVDELRAALDTTVAAATLQRSVIQTRCEQLEEIRRRRGQRLVQSLLAALAAFAFIDVFWWMDDEWKPVGPGDPAATHGTWFLEAVGLAALLILVSSFLLRSWIRGDDE